MAKKFEVTRYYHTQVTMIVEAENEEEAIEISETADYDMGQIFENLQKDGDTDAVEVEDEAVDMNGNPIKVGSKVKWYDPDESARDLSRVWSVFDVKSDGETVCISDDYSEAEVLPQELEVIG